jgi:hypothetical protein
MDIGENRIDWHDLWWCDTMQRTWFGLVLNFLDSSTSGNASVSAAAAATALTGPMMVEKSLQLAEIHPLHPLIYIYTIFSILIDIAIQIPPNHICHRRLAALVRALRINHSLQRLFAKPSP